MAKYVFGLIDKEGRLRVYSSDSSLPLKRIRSKLTKSKRYLEVSRILKASKPLPAMFNVTFKKNEAIA